jgi:transcriptional regulator with XRE-family HTH domain
VPASCLNAQDPPLLGMSQEKLTEVIGLTFQQVQKCECGSNHVGSSRLFDLTHVLDVPITYSLTRRTRAWSQYCTNAQRTVRRTRRERSDEKNFQEKAEVTGPVASLECDTYGPTATLK